MGTVKTHHFAGVSFFFPLTLGILLDAIKGGRTKKSWDWDCSPRVEGVLSVCEAEESKRINKLKVAY